MTPPLHPDGPTEGNSYQLGLTRVERIARADNDSEERFHRRRSEVQAEGQSANIDYAAGAQPSIPIRIADSQAELLCLCASISSLILCFSHFGANTLKRNQANANGFLRRRHEYSTTVSESVRETCEF